MRGVGRVPIAALTWTKTTGLDHFPEHGALRRYRLAGQPEEIVEHTPGEAHLRQAD